MRYLFCLLVLSIFSGCQTPAPSIPKGYRLVEVDSEKFELWERPDGTRFVFIELPSGKPKTMDVR